MTVGRRPPDRRPRRARSTLRHRGRPTLSYACSYRLSSVALHGGSISSSLAPFGSSRMSRDLGVDGLLDPAEPEFGPTARLGDSVARASLKEAEPELVFRSEERAQDADRGFLAPHLRCRGASAGGRRCGPVRARSRHVGLEQVCPSVHAPGPQFALPRINLTVPTNVSGLKPVSVPSSWICAPLNQPSITTPLRTVWSVVKSNWPSTAAVSDCPPTINFRV